MNTPGPHAMTSEPWSEQEIQAKRDLHEKMRNTYPRAHLEPCETCKWLATLDRAQADEVAACEATRNEAHRIIETYKAGESALVQRLRTELEWYTENMSCCYRCDGPEKEGTEPMRHKPGCETAALLAPPEHGERT